ncbi:MAG: hypothetical protein IJ297_05690 [Clostridia bacterium]|nr:hypothetical protein [Clostridia bacterium]
MEGLKLFLKENRVKRENVFYSPAEDMRDEKGDKIQWEIRHITTSEDEQIREDCIREAHGKGIRVDYNLYLKKLCAASVVYPPLYNARLQDSYGVKTPEDLLIELLDNPGEYQEFVKFVQRINGFDVTMAERVEKAKNS